MKLTVLGCGDAFGSGGRFNTSFLLTEGGKHILVDCGASTLIRLKQEGVELEKVETIIVSHFHGDHFGGIPFFIISSLFESTRNCPLTIVGPIDIKNKVYELLEAMYPGTVEKLNTLELQFCEFQKNGSELKLEDLEVSAWQVEHSKPSSPHGIRLKWNGKTFSFSGDTSWTDNLIPISNEADLFICECNFLHNQAYGHLSYDELVDRRASLNCNNIWLSHMGNDVLNLEDAIFNRLEDGLKIEF